MACVRVQHLPARRTARLPSNRPRRRRTYSRRRDRLARVVLPIALAAFSQTAWAVDASDYLLLPTVIQGEREIDWRTGIASSGSTANAQTDYALGLGYGVTAHWFTEVAVHYGQRQGSTLQFKDVAWENILQLSEPGEWPVDVGIAFEIEHSQASQDQMNVTAGALMQKEFGLVQVNFNFLVTHVIEGTETAATRVHYQGQLKYRYSEPLEFGIQAFGNVSSCCTTWASYPEQVHRLGPVALGKFKFARERSLSYNAAFLFGTTHSSPDRTLRFQIEYEF